MLMLDAETMIFALAIDDNFSVKCHGSAHMDISLPSLVVHMMNM